MTPMDLDMLVSAGYSPWMPTAGATDVDVWYVSRSAALHGRPPQPMAENADTDTLLRTAQGVLAGRGA